MEDRKIRALFVAVQRTLGQRTGDAWTTHAKESNGHFLQARNQGGSVAFRILDRQNKPVDEVTWRGDRNLVGRAFAVRPDERAPVATHRSFFTFLPDQAWLTMQGPHGAPSKWNLADGWAS